jgi:hypothetical protein
MRECHIDNHHVGSGERGADTHGHRILGTRRDASRPDTVAISGSS